MAQARKKAATRTKKATQKRRTGSRANTRMSKKQQQAMQAEKMHVYIVTAMAMITGLLLWANAAMLIA